MTPLLPDPPLDYIRELGYRFPDMTNDEVMLAYSEFVGISAIPLAESYWGYIILLHYDEGVNAADGTYGE